MNKVKAGLMGWVVMAKFTNRRRSLCRQATLISLLLLSAGVFVLPGLAQVNSGSDGSDGAFNPTSNITIDMADHPNGVYNYTSVNIPAGVTVKFIPNTANTPVTWLVQNNCTISGTVDVSGKSATNEFGAAGGPGGYGGGNGGVSPSVGLGPGGGGIGSAVLQYGTYIIGGNGSYGSMGTTNNGVLPGSTYGSPFLIPLVGGSGCGGCNRIYNGYGSYIDARGGGGGGGAILIAVSGSITVNGTIIANGGGGGINGYGSGGGIRLVANTINGNGAVGAGGSPGGCGRIRFDSPVNAFAGSTNRVFSTGYQPVIMPAANQAAHLTVASVGGVPVPPSPTGKIATPDALLSAQQENPVSIVVNCTNIPLNTPITVTVCPSSGMSVSAVGYNSSGTTASSTATVSINMPHGGGLIYATTPVSN